MAKKGGLQHLQIEVNTDEDLEKFLERQGLLVMDVYTEWCGPCTGMVGSLKKIKLEIGGDNLHLAICKADNIAALERFRNKSEPTWLFGSTGKAINIMFGTNVPELMRMITDELHTELEYQEGHAQRKFYEINELQPLEAEEINAKLAYEKEMRLIEEAALKKKKYDHLVFVTEEVSENLYDHGVTIFAPHISRDQFKSFLDPAKELLLQCKDQKMITILPENLEILNFQCPNKLPDEIWNYLVNKELLICLWKKGENDERDMADLMLDLVYKLESPRLVKDIETNTMVEAPPIILAKEVTLLPNGVEVIKEEPKEEEVVVEEKKDDDLMGFDFDIDLNLGGDLDADLQVEAEESEMLEESDSKMGESEEEEIELTYLLIPGVWAPGNHIGHAAAIYLFFKTHTASFLPPDPIPDPPHLLVVFDAYKRKNIEEVWDNYSDEVLLYGFFTSSDPSKTRLITNSKKIYDTMQPNVNDKLVLKIARETDHAVLNFAVHGPTYVSPNTVVGEEECKMFFPEGYKTGEMEEEELEEQNSQIIEKKKKRKKKKDQAGAAAASEISLEDQQELEELVEEEGEILDEEVIDEDVGEEEEGDFIFDENEQNPEEHIFNMENPSEPAPSNAENIGPRSPDFEAIP